MSKTQKLQRVALVIDESGSMQGEEGAVTETYNSWLRTLKEENAKNDMQTEVTIIKFDDRIRMVGANLDINGRIPDLEYKPQAYTALYTAVRHAVLLMESKYPEMSYLVVTITDGLENSSKMEDKVWVKDGGIKNLQATDKWTFAFLVPDKQGRRELENAGVPAGNIKLWETTEAGLREARVQTQSAMTKFYSGRASGQSCSTNFFEPLTTDLSHLKAAEIKKMQDISKQFKLYEVEKEAVIEPFVVAKTKRPYLKGDSYYQLMKKERVQDYKNILLREKKTGKIYGGADAKEALGMKPYQDYKLDPGNHANYDIFIQSSSVNRILPRGTKLLTRI